MERAGKILLGVGTVWPFAYMLFFLGSFVFLFTELSSMPHANKELPPLMMVLFPLHLLTMVEMLALLVVYVLHAVKNEHLDQNTRMLWAILLFVGNFMAFPIYYYLHILRPRSTAF